MQLVSSEQGLSNYPFPPCPLPGNDTNTCLCLNATVCEVFQKGYLMLYPFSTEYCLLCCAVLFVMWKNVGRRLAPHTGAHPGTPPFHLHGAIFGPLLGLLALVAGVCVFVLFQIEASGPTIARQYFALYYAFYVAVLPAMSLACLAGMAIHGLEERELDTLKNPTRSLDVVLLMGAALGQMGIAYFSIVAIVASRPHELLNRLILAYSLLLILQHIVQNLFIIEGLHRRPLWETVPEGPAGKQEAEPPRRGSLLELGQDLRRASLAYIHSYSHLNWKRRALKEISLFLILCNITVSGSVYYPKGDWPVPCVVKDTCLFPPSPTLLESSVPPASCKVPGMTVPSTYLSALYKRVRCSPSASLLSSWRDTGKPARELARK